MLPVIIIAMRFDWVYIALGLYTVATLSDFFDGYLARKLGQVSDFGKFLDPIADKIFIAAILLILADMDRLEGLWMIPAIVILVREFLISGLREFLGPKNITVPVSKLAKWKTTLQMIALGLLIAAPLGGLWLWGGHIMLSVAAVLTVITARDYLNIGLKHLD